MKTLKAIVVLLAMVLAACEGLKSPTEPQSFQEDTNREQTWPGDEPQRPDGPE